MNNGAYNAVAGFSEDGSQLYLHGHYTSSGKIPSTQGLAVSVRTEDGWSKPANIHIPYFTNKSAISSGSVSPDGRIFVFSAETYGTYGVEDIYVCFNEDGKWTEPKNLGADINTQFQELSPWMAPDGKTLYFSTNGRKGNGSFDIYSATRLDDTWKNWSTPVNIGSSINSDGRELFYREYPDMGFFIYTCTQSSDGYGDIRFVRFSNETQVVASASHALTYVSNPPVSSDAETENSGDSLAAGETITLYGRVTNAKTGETITARITAVTPEFSEQTTATESTGYSLTIPAATNITLKIEATGFVSAMDKIDVHHYDMKNFEMNVALQPVEVGTSVNLRNVLFAQATADILPESYPELDLVVEFLKDNPGVEIELSGHTDNRGVHRDNVRLSTKRVETVKAYLVSKGIDASRITGKGYGGIKPIASNDTEESRRLNRRVEFRIRKVSE